jgi:hypothetical protein
MRPPQPGFVFWLPGSWQSTTARQFLFTELRAVVRFSPEVVDG